MMAIHIIFLLVLLCVCCVGPGFYFLRRLPWNPLEKLCGSIGLSLVFIYLAAFAASLLKLDRWAYYAVSLCCLALAIAARRDLIGLFRARSVQGAVKWFVFLWAWTSALMLLVRHYSGGGWGGDWAEHYQRVAYFLGRWPEGSLFINKYKLPARPPMMNVVGAHFLGHLGALRFETYQVVFAFLNLLVFLPCCLMIADLARRGRRQLFMLGALFALNPVFVENVTYPWTKSFAGFYIILSIWFYLAALRKSDMVRMAAAFLAVSAGFLVHFSAGPYATFLGLHYLLRAWSKRRDRFRELAVAGGLSAILLATWFGWSMAAYGLSETLASNTTVTGAAGLSGSERMDRILHNVINTIVPHPFRDVGAIYQKLAGGQSTWGHARDYMFLIYQVNLVLGVGLVGGPLAVWLLFKTLRSARAVSKSRRQTRRRLIRHDPVRPRTPSERFFWVLFIPFCAFVGIAVVGQSDVFGLSHASLQPMILLGVTFLAGNLHRLGVLLRLAAVLGLHADFYLGILLQHYCQHAVVASWVRDGKTVATTVDGPRLGLAATFSGLAKQLAGTKYLGDYTGPYWVAVVVAIIVVSEIVMGLVLYRLVFRPLRSGPGGPPRASDGDRSSRRRRRTIAGSPAAT